tara:strand:- start:17 stop:211 length:195 start_codon:yes stop_codon:yes gene_type:complete
LVVTCLVAFTLVDPLVAVHTMAIVASTSVVVTAVASLYFILIIIIEVTKNKIKYSKLIIIMCRS